MQVSLVFIESFKQVCNQAASSLKIVNTNVCSVQIDVFHDALKCLFSGNHPNLDPDCF